LCGIREAGAELLVFVDDDNVLNSDYLENAIKLAADYPRIGAFGGSSIGVFEREPEEDVRFMVKFLAIKEVNEPSWACLPGTRAIHAAPVGAGMVVRKCIAVNYANKVCTDSLRGGLDRVGSKFMSCGDTDMVFCAYEEGYGIGLFPELELKHLIPGNRIEREYLLKLAEGIAYSFTILTYLWDGTLPSASPDRSERLLQCYKNLRSRLKGCENNSFAQQVNKVRKKAVLEAREFLLSL
jgi:hypothetical protein